MNKLCFVRVKQSLLMIFSILSVVACATDPNKLRLSDSGLRFWKGTYYLSVAGKPTSIKCSLSKHYQSSDDVPVVYKGQNAEPLFDLDDDLEKIANLKQQCYERSFRE